MTQEEIQLLLKDLCGRLPYGVKVTWDGKHPLTVTPHIYCAIASEDKIDNLPKLLLRPMSSMTEEEKKEFSVLAVGTHLFKGPLIPSYDTLDWLNAHHFDYRGLIERGLAIEAPEGMIRTFYDWQRELEFKNTKCVSILKLLKNIFRL